MDFNDNIINLDILALIMQKKGNVLYFGALVLVVIIGAIAIFYGPSIDFGKPLEIGKINPCVVSLDDTSFNLSEGENASTKIRFFTEEAGSYNIAFRDAPSFVVVDTPFIAQPFNDMTFDLNLFNY